jgi:polyisoprenoid-binding protein YceI
MKPLFAGASLIILALAACSPAPAPEAATPTIATAEITAPAPITIAAPAGDYAVDPTHASVEFKLHHLGLSYYGLKFRTYDATVSFDPANIAASKVSATIKASDILAGYPADYVTNHPGTKFKSWEDDLANSTNFLDAKQFPTITFVSTSVEPSGERSAKVTGDLYTEGRHQAGHARRHLLGRNGLASVRQGPGHRLLRHWLVQPRRLRPHLSRRHDRRRCEGRDRRRLHPEGCSGSRAITTRKARQSFHICKGREHLRFAPLLVCLGLLYARAERNSEVKSHWRAHLPSRR